MRYFIRQDNGLTQVDESTNPSYLQYALEHYKEITQEEYEALMQKEEVVKW